jgi:cytoskeletal protein CcmA (bactofilin family)
MKLYAKFASFLLLAALVFVPLQAAAAKGLTAGRVIFGQSITLKSGETMDGNLVVFGGSAIIEEGATVNGDTLLFGGNLVVDGEVSGDVAIAGGAVTLGAGAHIHGNLSTVGATLTQADGSKVDGQIYNTATSTTWVGTGSGTQPIPPAVALPLLQNLRVNWNPFSQALGAFGQALGLALLAMLLMLFLAPNAQRVASAITAQPLTTGGLGLLTFVVAPLAIVILAVTIILIPAAILAVLALVVVGVFGWIAVGLEIGQRFTKAIHQDWHPAFSAGLGTFVLSLLSSALTGLPVLNCIGWLVPTLLGLAAVGAVIMTRFGTQTVIAPVHVPAASAPVLPSGESKPK